MQILTQLKKIEQDFDIKILFAVEAGSRAWGYSSKTSDYDIRFVYVHNISWYLSLQDKADTIGTNAIPINGGLDIQGWELTKALKLLKKSNPSIIEWLDSPTIYMKTHFYDQLKELSTQYYTPKSLFYHHKNIINAHKKRYLMGNKVSIKRYFCTLRSALACKYIIKFKEPPPVEFDKLVDNVIKENCEIKYAINRLLLLKRNKNENIAVSKYKIIDSFIDDMLNVNIKYSITDPGYKALNDFFIKVLSYYQRSN